MANKRAAPGNVALHNRIFYALRLKLENVFAISQLMELHATIIVIPGQLPHVRVCLLLMETILNLGVGNLISKEFKKLIL